MIDIYNSLIQLFDFILIPIDTFLNDYGLNDIMIRLGFGTVTWFEMPLEELVQIVIMLLVYWVFVRFIYNLIKNFFKMVVGWLK